MAGTVTYLNIFLRIVADPRQQFIAHQLLASLEQDVNPVAQGYRKAVPRQESDRAVPQRQAIEEPPIIEADVERENRGPREPNASVFDGRAFLFSETGMPESKSLLSGHGVACLAPDTC
ncbi:MAG: hypothetical protein WBQ86_23360 [Candidatus Binatus sp.]